MKENDMLEQMFSAVAQLLGQREEAMLERIAALEKKVEELEQKLEEAAQAGVPVVASVAEIGEDVSVEDAVESDEVLADEDFAEEELVEDDFEDVVVAENIAEDDIEEVIDVDEEIPQVEELDGEEVVDDEPASEHEMEIELEFLDDEEYNEVEDAEVEEMDVSDDDQEGWADEYSEGDEEVGEIAGKYEEEPVLVVDKARPDWYDWEVDIPGAYIEDIWDGIGLNDRLLFLQVLFRGDEIDFSETLDALNEMTTLAEAVEYLRGRYSFWDEEGDEVYRFYMTVRRRFNKQRQ